MVCRICGLGMQQAFRHEVLGKYDVAYYKCGACGFLCAEEPYWLAEAYENTITHADTGLLQRNITLSRQVAVLIYRLFNRTGRYLDYAGGYGVFTRLMHDAGFDFYHTDPYTKNLFAQGLEWDGTMAVDGVTCFECFEHLTNPMDEIRQIVQSSKTVFFTTALMSEEVPPVSWDYYGFDHGQHISFYTPRTLEHIARELDVSVASVGNLHLFTPKPIAQKKLKTWVRKANRLPHPFARRTSFESVVRKMRKLDRGAAR